MNKTMTRAKILEFFITNRCTLNCKMCLCSIPYIENPMHTPKETIFKEFEKAFELYDELGRVEIIGGEPLMHPDIAEIIEDLLKYKDKYPKIRITTNATIIPNKDLISTIKKAEKMGIEGEFLLDNYGDISCNINNIIQLLKKEKIPYRVDRYVGDNQRFNGWLCYGNYTLINETEEELKKKFDNCLCPKLDFHDTHNGKIYSCVYAMTGTVLNKFKLNDDEYVDLFNEKLSIEEKRKITTTFLTKPTVACRYCNGFYEGAPRFQAAEQL